MEQKKLSISSSCLPASSAAAGNAVGPLTFVLDRCLSVSLRLVMMHGESDSIAIIFHIKWKRETEEDEDLFLVTTLREIQFDSNHFHIKLKRKAERAMYLETELISGIFGHESQ